MLNSKTDYFFIIIFFIVVAAFLGISIVNIIDKKLSNISINVPKIKLPPSEVTVNFEKNGSSYKVKCSKKKIKSKNINEKNLKKDINNLEQESVNLEDENINLEDEDINLEDENINLEDENINLEENLDKDKIEISYSDFDSDIEGDEIKVGQEIRENMSGLTAEQFFNKHYVNPYKPIKKKFKKTKEFEAFNNINYQ